MLLNLFFGKGDILLSDSVDLRSDCTFCAVWSWSYTVRKSITVRKKVIELISEALGWRLKVLKKNGTMHGCLHVPVYWRDKMIYSLHFFDFEYSLCFFLRIETLPLITVFGCKLSLANLCIVSLLLLLLTPSILNQTMWFWFFHVRW